MRDAPANLLELKFPPASLPDEAAAEIVRRFADRLPNLSFLTVVLPNLQAATPFKQALRVAADHDVLLLPRFFTLAMLAEEQPLDRPVAPPSLRLAQIYSALKARDWFDVGELWDISAELAQLIDDLTRAQSELPVTADDFVRVLEQGYAARPDAAMHFEARVAHEMWLAFSRASADDPAAFIDAAAACQLRLAAFAANATGPLCVIGPPQPSAMEKAFLCRYAERQAVLLFDVDERLAADPFTRCLVSAWPGPDETPTEIRARAESFHAGNPSSPLGDRVSCYGAASLEDEALVAADAIRQWLLDGKRNIALVAADRLTVRRVRALLERDDILLADESGWTLSTTSASTVIMRLLETISDGFYHRDVLDLAKSPFFATDWESERKKRAVHRLDALVRENNFTAGLERLQRLVSREDNTADEGRLLRRLARAHDHLEPARQTLAIWLGHLSDALADIGASPGLSEDMAGRQLLELLSLRRQELAGHGERMNFAEWRRWLNAELEAATFRDDCIDSPIVLATLTGTRLRHFEAVVVVGADAEHLASRPARQRLFNQSVRRELRLPGAADAAAQLRSDLIGLISRSDSVLFTWQAGKGGEANAASPWITRLATFHAIAYEDDLQRPPTISRNTLQTADGVSRLRPAPAVPPALMPEQVSASAYGSLMACPYQFYARYLLRLNERDEVSEEMEKRDYGNLVHAVLARFHRQLPLVSDAGIDAEALLREITDEVFRAYLDNNYTALAWKMRWQKMIPAYLEWQRRREVEGWRFHAAEQKFEQTIPLAHGATVRLQGRVDRIDERSDSSLSVLDYKTQKKSALMKRLEPPGEDVQLAVYALLVGDVVKDAAYIGLDDGNAVAEASVGEPVNALAEAARERLIGMLDRMARGQSLPAQGAPAVCAHCEMRGLCRLDYWDAVE